MTVELLLEFLGEKLLESFFIVVLFLSVDKGQCNNVSTHISNFPTCMEYLVVYNILFCRRT